MFGDWGYLGDLHSNHPLLTPQHYGCELERVVQGRRVLAGEEGDEAEKEELGENKACQDSKRQSFSAKQKKCLVSRGYAEHLAAQIVIWAGS